jgi:hypothetical protein
MVRLRSVDVVSCAKIYGILHMAIGVVVGLLFVLIGLVGFAAAPGQQKFGMIGVLIFAALSPFLYGLFGFIVGAVMALLYNWVASAIGGIKVELEAVPVLYVVPPSQPPAPHAAV